MHRVALSDYTTMRVGGLADFLIEISTEQDLVDAIEWAESNNLPTTVLGLGANTIFTDEGFKGLVIVNKLEGIQVVEENDEHTIVQSASGEIWDDLVEFTVSKGLTGIEALTLVPGSVGAAPVQNIGCYGQELADTFHSLEAYDTKAKVFVQMEKDECRFSYRSSIFKTTDKNYEKGRYIITSISLKLKKGQMQPPFYTTLQKYLDEHRVTDYSPASIRKALIVWRTLYLPDPNVVANSGSFFANPIVDKAKLEEIIHNNPEIEDLETKWYWQLDDGTIKIAAGRLADAIGLKDWHDNETGMSTWKNSALIVVNEAAKGYKDLADFKQKYINAVKAHYGIELQQEPDLIEPQ